MAYDRYDRDERSRWAHDHDDRNWRGEDRDRGRDERGFFERAGDEISSWFGDEEAERRRRQDTRRDERMGGSDRDYDRGYGRDAERDRSAYGGGRSDRDFNYGGGRSDRDFNYDRGVFNRGGSSERDYNPGWRRELWGGGERNRGRDFGRERDRSYRPMTGDYGRAEHESDQFFAASGVGRGERGAGEYYRSQTPYGRDDYRRTSFAGSREGSRDRDFDPHYRSWRERHMSDLDRDYDDFRREHQSKFESDFGSWRERRQEKRGLLGQVHEHMEVVGKDDEHVGTVDRTAGDRIILAKSDPESGGVHHSLSCSDIHRVEGDKVILDCSADEAKERWRDENRSRALFEREDQGEMGPRTLNRSFEGTYR
jgi:hypothetical protein